MSLLVTNVMLPDVRASNVHVAFIRHKQDITARREICWTTDDLCALIRHAYRLIRHGQEIINWVRWLELKSCLKPSELLMNLLLPGEITTEDGTPAELQAPCNIPLWLNVWCDVCFMLLHYKQLPPMTRPGANRPATAILACLPVVLYILWNHQIFTVYSYRKHTLHRSIKR